MRILLDTNAYSALMAGHPGAKNLVSLSERLYIPLPVIGELLFGFQLGSRHEANLKRLMEFQDHPMTSLVGLDYETCEVYARIGSELRSMGKPIPTNDHWIAAIAIRNNLTLMTRDRHFSHVKGLSLKHWDG